MKFIIGLGNPGSKYDTTKHNIGFTVVKALAKENGIKIYEKLHFSLCGRGIIAGEDVMLVLPQTFMNHSGNAVGELSSHGLKDISDLVVVCDDINLELGRIRIRKSGSSGGHKGLEAIVHTLSAGDFARLRVGIATDVHKGDITGYVLSPFKRKEKRNAAHSVSLAKDALEAIVKYGIDKAMARYNKRKTGTS